MQDIQIAHGLGFNASVEARLSTHQVYEQYFRSHARSTLAVAAGAFSLETRVMLRQIYIHHSSLPVSPANPEEGELRQVQDHLVQSV